MCSRLKFTFAPIGYGSIMTNLFDDGIVKIYNVNPVKDEDSGGLQS